MTNPINHRYKDESVHLFQNGSELLPKGKQLKTPVCLNDNASYHPCIVYPALAEPLKATRKLFFDIWC